MVMAHFFDWVNLSWKTLPSVGWEGQVQLPLPTGQEYFSHGRLPSAGTTFINLSSPPTRKSPGR